ncbi:MAG: ABC transporter ATP-binding protein [Oscillospiraceae bacterium]|nr:ABC transporter ATP-binding protein [Oscillospiraceae bacterium]MBR3474782.1 ABC transporter ATP-binding protein [Oscillospiraceae bacterium]
METTLLTVRDLRVEYRTDDATVYAVNGVSFNVGKGESLGLIGETGAGKTSIALSIMRLLPDRIGVITGGKILLDGTDITAAGESAMCDIRGEKVSMIFQDPMTSLNPVMEVGDQIEEVLLLHRPEMTVEQRRKKTDEILEMIGIPAERKHEYPHQFSGGMKQRIVIAIALACEPMLLLADEPTTALDVTIQAQVLEMMNGLKEKLGTSIVLITHDFGVVAQTCDRVAVIYAGEVVEIGTAYDLFEGEDHHPYTQGLFGSIPNMNVDEERLHPIEGLMPDPTILAKGCSFADRCPYAQEVCFREKPHCREKNGHRVFCRFSKYPEADREEDVEYE